ncbi:MAG: DUF393 domain-containing protein [Chlamydiia bacterium]|nr:DUF393 domain-containing protein [Chlamydiia bacterium]
MKHLIFYDGLCGLCDRIVRLFLWADKKEIFLFAPLQGETAAKMNLPEMSADTMILVENREKVLIMGVAALRAFWLLGGFWRLIGIFYFILPSCIPNFFYRIVARNRHRIFAEKECIVFPHEYEGRFLP